MSRRIVLLVGIDGLRLDDALKTGTAPHLAALIARGRLEPVTMEVPTISGPGWSSILTGASHAEHGVFDNSFQGHTLHRNADFLSRAYFGDRSRTTFAATGWPPILDPAGPGPIVQTRLDQQRSGQHRLVIRDGETFGYRWADGEVTAASKLVTADHGHLDEGGHGGAEAVLTRSFLAVARFSLDAADAPELPSPVRRIDIPGIVLAHLTAE